ncbi:MAG: EamA/RhaT family transporter, partial [Anaerolineae bacterium]|nr:EamA/RhaT family transporter [Anaerolineae bacterium]
MASALSWGGGDFSGGLATKRASVYSVIIVAQVVGAIGLAVLATTLGEPWPGPGDMLYGALAGISGVIGLA